MTGPGRGPALPASGRPDQPARRGWVRRPGAGALVAGIAAAVTLAGPAPAAEAAACGGSSGVTVVVDFGSLGGGVRVSCAAGDPASGLSALSGAGYGYSFVPRQPGLVCQINAKPNPCNGAPTSAYWSYWHANRGGSWSYSTSGAGSYNPRAGTVEGWAFGAGARPAVAPPAPAAAPAPPPAPKPPPRPKPTTRAPAPPPAPAPVPPPAGSGPTARPGTSADPAPGTSLASPGRSPAATTTPGSPTAGPSTDPAAGETSAPPSDGAALPPSPATEPVSSSSGLARSALGAAVVAALAVTGLLVARRRRAGQAG